MLGVDRKASREEIRRSYRRLARRYHPDARNTSGALTVVGAADIVRVNEAWRVLRDPTLRRQYDATLRSRPVVPLRFDDREGWGELFDPIYTPVQRRPRPPVLRPGRRVLGGRVSIRALLVAGLLVGLAMILVFTAYAGGGGPGGVSGSGSTAPVGSCVTIPAGQPAKLLPCGQTNDGMVVAPVNDGRSCPRGAVPRALEPGAGPSVCLVPR